MHAWCRHSRITLGRPSSCPPPHPHTPTHRHLPPPPSSSSQNFDEVLVEPGHVSRSPNDTYYVNSATVLRTHTSAHQAEFVRTGQTAFLVTGDVYRRDSIDATHYPVFHQVQSWVGVGWGWGWVGVGVVMIM